jgi:hypothetical protein
MPTFDFDDDQLSGELPPEPTVRTIQVAQPAPVTKPQRRSVAVDDDDDIAMLDKVLYYRDLATAPLFADTDDPAAIEVEIEVQDFCRGRIRELMGQGQKRRGRKPAPITVFENKGRRATGRVEEGRGGGRRDASRARPVRGPLTPTVVLPKGAEPTGHAIVQEVTDPQGFKMQRTYRQMLDKASGKNYYLCYVKGSLDSVEQGDGNKYELGSNANGGQYFRVISEQTLPEGVESVKPMTLAAITAASRAHAEQTLAAINNGKNTLLASAIAASLKE